MLVVRKQLQGSISQKNFKIVFEAPIFCAYHFGILTDTILVLNYWCLNHQIWYFKQKYWLLKPKNLKFKIGFLYFIKLTQGISLVAFLLFDHVSYMGLIYTLSVWHGLLTKHKRPMHTGPEMSFGPQMEVEISFSILKIIKNQRVNAMKLFWPKLHQN